MRSIFISHSSVDKATADAVAYALEREGITCWIAPRDIPAGSNYGAEISRAIRECAALVLIYSENSNTSNAVCREVQMAFDMQKIIIPLRIHKVSVSDDLNFYLSGLHWLDIDPSHFDFSGLLHTVRPVVPAAADEAAYVPQAVQAFAPPQATPPVYAPPEAPKEKFPVAALAVAACVILCLVLVGIVVLGDFGGNNNSAPNRANENERESEATFSQSGLSPEEIFANSADAVFQIFTYDERGHRESSGSGFFISADGIAITNHHVLDGAHDAVILTNNEEIYNVSGYYIFDDVNDLTVFQIYGSGFHFLNIGDSAAVQVGEDVYAIGSPHGNQNTFSRSYVSMLLADIFFDGYRPTDVIQITAPIFPGSSGGALLNGRGEVVGVTSAIDLNRASVAFAIPVTHINIWGSVGGNPLPLPFGSAQTAQSHQTHPVPDNNSISDFARFPGVPDFSTVSRSSAYIESYTNFLHDGFLFDELFLYSLPVDLFIPETDMYDDILMSRGFIIQEVINYSESTMLYFMHEHTGVSVVYDYYWDDEEIYLGIGTGNAWATIYGMRPPQTPLLGSWTTSLQTLTYFADGSGFMENFDASGRRTVIANFLFTANNGVLTYTRGPLDGSWMYSVNDNVITFTSLDDGLVLSYRRN
jgi:hypothetical protein